MKQGLLVVGLLLVLAGRAEASVLDWPVVSQASNVVRCIVSDAGTIGKSFITHASGFVVETFTTVGECLLYVANQVTPGIVSEPATPAPAPQPEVSHVETPH